MYLEDDENGEEHKHKEQEAAGVQREQVVFVGEVGLRDTKKEFLNEPVCDTQMVRGRQ